MALISIGCRIAFASNPFDTTPTWVDVSSSIMSFTIRRGRQYELNRMEAGTAQVQLLNLSGDFWPNNTGGTYYPNVLPWKRINIRATYNSITYDLYTGYIESWNPDFISKPIKGPVMNLTCSDLVKNLSKFLLNDETGYSQELSGTRINNVLNDLGWPSGDRTIDTGQSYVQATGELENVNAMNHLFTVQDTELGMLFIGTDGKVIYQDRHKRLISPFITSQATFGDDLVGGELPYAGIMPALEETQVYNDIRVKRLDGTEQAAGDATSQGLYGKRGLQRPSLLMTTDAEALAQAQYLLIRYKNPAMRVKQITIIPSLDSDNLFPKALGYDISTRITICLSEASIDKEYHIEGIEHLWKSTSPDLLTTKWMLTDADVETYWVLGQSGYSELGETTWLAF